MSIAVSKLMGKLIFVGRLASRDVVITRFGHYAKLDSKPGTVPWGLGTTDSVDIEDNNKITLSFR